MGERRLDETGLRKIGRPVTEPRRKGTNLRLPDDLHAALREAADDREVSVNKLITWACRDYLSRLLPPDEVKWTR